MSRHRSCCSTSRPSTSTPPTRSACSRALLDDRHGLLSPGAHRGGRHPSTWRRHRLSATIDRQRRVTCSDPMTGAPESTAPQATARHTARRPQGYPNPVCRRPAIRAAPSTRAATRPPRRSRMRATHPRRRAPQRTGRRRAGHRDRGTAVVVLGGRAASSSASSRSSSASPAAVASKRGEANNGGVALAGIILGFLAIIVGLAFIAIWVGVFKEVGASDYIDCLQKAGQDQNEVQQCADEFKQIRGEQVQRHADADAVAWAVAAAAA